MGENLLLSIGNGLDHEKWVLHTTVEPTGWRGGTEKSEENCCTCERRQRLRRQTFILLRILSKNKLFTIRPEMLVKCVNFKHFDSAVISSL